MMRKRSRNILIFLFSMTVSAVIGVKFFVPMWLFQRFVINPIPASVKNIRTDTSLGLGEHKYVIGFEINKEDIPLILNSKGFKEIGFVEYYDGEIIYGERWEYLGHGFENAHVLDLYDRSFDKSPPGWFTLLGEWDDFDHYVVEKIRPDFYGVKLLLYNEELGKAYFFDHELRGTGIGDPSPTKEEMQRKWEKKLLKEREIKEKRHDEPNNIGNKTGHPTD